MSKKPKKYVIVCDDGYLIQRGSAYRWFYESSKSAKMVWYQCLPIIDDITWESVIKFRSVGQARKIIARYKSYDLRWYNPIDRSRRIKRKYSIESYDELMMIHLMES